MQTTDVIVAGGGIVGLSVALEAARAGLSVCVMERGRLMAEASWAAAGMLAAEDPDHPAELVELAALSIALYPEFLDLVERLSGLRVPLRTRATLMASRRDFDCSITASRYPVSEQEARERIPELITEGRSFLWLKEASLDPRDLCVALPRAAAAAGARLQQETEVLSVVSQSGSVEVRTPRGTVSAGAFVNCCGAWAANLEAGALPAVSVEPWKGQMVSVRMPPAQDLAYVLRSSDVYMVPRGGGHIVVGATVEQVGFDRRVEPWAVERLLRLAADLWPPIPSGQVVERWSGLRPGTADGLPLIGSGGAPHCWMATGHFRNGILLAPGTARVVRQLLQESRPEAGLEAFFPGRVSDKLRSAAL